MAPPEVAGIQRLSTGTITVSRILSCFLVLLCAGCASYRTPGGPAPLEQLDRAAVAEGSTRQPAPQLPASLAVARVQAPAYRTASAMGVGEGRYSVVATPDLPTAAQLRQIAAWAQVDRADLIDPAWLPPKFDSLDDLRAVAAKMQADVLLVCTLDTVFETQDHKLAAGSSLALGDKPAGPVTVAVTATALFVDVRTGYAYGRSQASATADASAVLARADTVDAKRLEVERAAFTQLLGKAGETWAGIVRQYQ